MRTRRLAIGLCALPLLAAGCGGASHVPCPNGKVNFGVEPYAPGAKFTKAYTDFASTLSDKLGCPVRLHIAKSYTDEVAAMKAGKLDVAEFGALGYVFAHRRAGAEPVATFSDIQGNPISYYAGIWAKKGSPVKTINDLRGKTLALAERTSTSGALYPLYALSSNGLKKSDVNISYTGSHDQALAALTSGTADAAEINSDTMAAAVKAKKLVPAQYQQVWKSDPIPNDPIVVRRGLTPAFKDAVRKTLLALSKDDMHPVDRVIGLGAGQLLPANDAIYDNVRAVVDANHLPFSALDN